MLLPLLLACAATGSSAETGISVESVADVYETPCEESRLSGTEVPGADGPAVYQVETCGGESCRPAYDAVRRDGDVIFASCGEGVDVVRIVLLR